MVNTKIICKTDAAVLLDFVQLKDSGFAFLLRWCSNWTNS